MLASGSRDQNLDHHRSKKVVGLCSALKLTSASQKVQSCTDGQAFQNAGRNERRTEEESQNEHNLHLKSCANNGHCTTELIRHHDTRSKQNNTKLRSQNLIKSLCLPEKTTKDRDRRTNRQHVALACRSAPVCFTTRGRKRSQFTITTHTNA